MNDKGEYADIEKQKVKDNSHYRQSSMDRYAFDEDIFQSKRSPSKSQIDSNSR